MAATLVQITAVALALIFAWAAAAKAMRPRAWTEALGAYALPRPVRAFAGAGVPAAELGVAGLIFWGPARAGASLAVTLLAAFSLAVARAGSLRPGKLPCGCFGRAPARDPEVMLVRNAVLAGMAAVVLLGGERVEAGGGLDVPRPGEVLPAALVVLGVAVALWMVVATRRWLSPENDG
jgi:hypothetical protein